MSGSLFIEIIAKLFIFSFEFPFFFVFNFVKYINPTPKYLMRFFVLYL